MKKLQRVNLGSVAIVSAIIVFCVLIVLGFVKVIEITNAPREAAKAEMETASVLERQEKAQSSDLDWAVAEVLAQDEEVSVREYLAQNTSIKVSASACCSLAEDEAVSVREYLAQNTGIKVSPNACFSLAKDEEVSVREYLAQNPSITESAIRTLARDEATSVREYLAHNPYAKVYDDDYDDDSARRHTSALARALRTIL